MGALAGRVGAESGVFRMIKTGRVKVWRLKLDRDEWTAARIDAWRGVLSVEELRRADAFRRADLRRDYLLAHVALRSVLGKETGVSSSEVVFAANSEKGGSGERKKPALLHVTGDGFPDRFPDLRFNLSHTSGEVLMAVTLGREVGIDIELRRPIEGLEGMARSVMSNEEFAGWTEISGVKGGLDGSGPSERFLAFYNVWTRKEAYLKAIGLGLYRDLQEVTVPVSARRLEGGPDVSVLSRNQGNLEGEEIGWRQVVDRSGQGDWMVADIPVEDKYSASICCEGSEVPQVEYSEVNLE